MLYRPTVATTAPPGFGGGGVEFPADTRVVIQASACRIIAH
jgi:hypothetical protein